ncbi:MAG: nuclear transport factor 2 family protein [Rhodospirillaceae bacterium]|nr:nuclear transport factor 2 family protein [Rhodospirillaceae bacterium]
MSAAAGSTEPSKDRRAELADLTDRFVDAFNRRGLADVMSFFAADAVYEEAFGDKHEGKAAISAALAPVVDGGLGEICFEGEDRFIDPAAGKVMDSWRLHMHRGEGAEKERTLRGLDLLHFEGRELVRKVTYKQDGS